MAVKLYRKTKEGAVESSFFPAKRVMSNIKSGWVTNPDKFKEKNGIDDDLKGLDKQQLIDLTVNFDDDFYIDKRMKVETMQKAIMEHRNK